MNINKTVFSLKSVDEGKRGLRIHLEVVIKREMLVHLSRIAVTLFMVLLAALNMPQAAQLLAKITA